MTSFVVDFEEFKGAGPIAASAGVPFSPYHYGGIQGGVVNRSYGWAISVVQGCVYLLCGPYFRDFFHRVFDGFRALGHGGCQGVKVVHSGVGSVYEECWDQAFGACCIINGFYGHL